ncbi:MAG TPA: prepilin-type N-terminal cleavage/methylation domain-containing protein [Thermoanaerobaculia bacterium]|nr:prepilin-type N-terminal cleavage/methylation domain-containing protein [Thermoanaerobaculia bacterium]
MRTIQKNQRGYSLAEILVVLAVSTAVMILCYDIIDDAMRTSLYVESHNNLTQLAQRPVNFMQNEVYQNKVIFDATTGSVGPGYLTRFTSPPAYPGAWPSCASGGCGGATTTLPALPALYNNSALPITDTSGVLGPDAGTGAARMTGNILFVVRQLPPILIPYDHDNNALTANINFPADRYRFEMYYLTKKTTRSFGSTSYYLDLIQARSIDFADYFQLNPVIGASSWLNATGKAQIVNGLAAAGINIAFDPSNQPVTNAFYSIGATGTMTLQSGQGIWIYTAKSMLPEFSGGSISGKILYSVGFRPSATTRFPISGVGFDSSGNQVLGVPIPKYAVFDSTKPELPSGFEVKLVSSGGARKIILRLVLLSNYKAGTYEAQEGFAVASTSS